MGNPRIHLLPFVLVLVLSLSNIFSSLTSADPPPTQVKVGVVFDVDSLVGPMYRTCINMAVSDFYSAHPNSTTRLLLLTRDSHGDVVDAASAAVDLLINEHVQAIIGPQTSSETAFVADIGAKAQVPIISFSATSPSLSPSRAPYFIRTVPGDAEQVGSIAALVKAFGWQRVVPIYENKDYGTALIPYLIDALDAVGASVPYRSALPTSASDERILSELYMLKTMQTRVFVVHATSALGLRLFAKAKEAEMISEGFVWIATAGLTSLLDSLDPDSMQGVIGVKPYIPRSKQFHEFRKRWRKEFFNENENHAAANVLEPNPFGVWAYDTIHAVAMAAEAAGMAVGREEPTAVTADLSAIGISENGGKLLESILKTEFDGLGGRFRLVGRERNVTAFEIVNVVGEMGRGIGYWTARYGLSRRLNWTSESSYSASAEGLGAMIWPGESTALPRGWVEPTSGRKLRIAVPGPVDPGFHSFLNVEVDQTTNETVASGYVIEVFEAAVRQLPYALPFEYVEYRAGDGKTKGDYNNLVQQVFLERFDAVVGDVTITANRSLYVDFTLPYTVSGVSMVVPARDERGKNAWVFLKPLKTDLWLVSGVFFIFTGIVVWALEHRINPEFRGPPAHQIGSVFYFSFSTLVFAHKEAIVSNLSRVVVIIWVFVVLILQSSYIASLTSMLTVQQLRPMVTEMGELKKSGEHVGYLKDSFVQGFLIKQGFSESKLRPYKSPREYKEALEKGSSNGGVAAVVDEIPYLRVFLKDYCDNYTMAGQTYKTGGFGFVFPKGSPLVPDLSRAILNISEGDNMVEIERRWFGDPTACPNEGSPISSNSLDFKSFWGLFLITGTVSILSLLIFLASFLYKNRHVVVMNNGIASVKSLSWGRIRSIARLFDQKDLSAHTFKRDELKDGCTMGNREPVASLYDANGTESPLSISNHGYEDGAISAELVGSSPETPPSVEMVAEGLMESSPHGDAGLRRSGGARQSDTDHGDQALLQLFRAHRPALVADAAVAGS